MTAETIALHLQEFWRAEGCLTAPQYAVLGDRGLTPALFFGALRNGTWRACQIEEVAGYSDFGQQPYLRLHRRFQVILKGEKGETQDVYLACLRELGVDPSGHDLRFVPESWDSPCLATRGYGWGVQLDWVRIGSICYLREVGGITPDPIPIRAIYDLEPLAMFMGEALEPADDLAPLAEDQFEKYVREQTDVARLNSIFDQVLKESDEAIDNGLFFPAYDLALVCQRLIETLAARRGHVLLDLSDHRDKVAQLAHRCANAYLEVQHA